MERLVVNQQIQKGTDVGSQVQTDVLLAVDELIIVQRINGGIIGVKAWSFLPAESGTALLRIFGSESALQRPDTRFWVDTPHFTLVPRRMATDDAGAALFANLTESQSAPIIPVVWPDMECVAYYTIPTAFQSFLTNKSIGCLPLELLKKQRNLAESDGFTAFAQVFGSHIYVSIFDRKRVIFTNSFTYENAKDALYVILLAYEQANATPATTPLWLSGMIIADSEIYRMLTRFIRTIRFSPYPTLPEPLTAVKPHFLFYLS
jgi:hypothetical protein